MNDRIPIMEIYLHYGGRTARYPKAYGWTACYCVLPGHDDKTASAQINEDSARWRCLACAVNCDAIALVMAIENLNFRDGKRRAEHLAGGSDTAVRAEPRRDGSLLPIPRRARDQRDRKAYRPPWLRGGAGGGA